MQTFTEHAFGQQFSSLKPSGHGASFARATRKQLDKLHISHEHDKLTNGGVSPGAIYNVTYHDGVRPYSFGKADRDRSAMSSANIQEAPYHPLVERFPASQVPAIKSVVFGTSLREYAGNDYSPGPAEYHNGTSILNRAKGITFGHRTQLSESHPQTTPELGPGAYPIPSTCGGAQFSSTIANQPVYSFGQSPEKSTLKLRRWRSQPALFLPNLDSVKRTAPRPVMSTISRDQWTKQAVIPDKPTRSYKPILEHPRLPIRREIIAWSS